MHFQSKVGIVGSFLKTNLQPPCRTQTPQSRVIYGNTVNNEDGGGKSVFKNVIGNSRCQHGSKLTNRRKCCIKILNHTKYIIPLSGKN